MSQLPETRTRYDAAMSEWYLRGSNRGEPPPRKEDYPDVYDGPPEESTSPLPQDGRIDKRTGPREEPIFIPPPEWAERDGPIRWPKRRWPGSPSPPPISTRPEIEGGGVDAPGNPRRSLSLGYGAGRSLSQREEPPWWERGTIGPRQEWQLANVRSQSDPFRDVPRGGFDGRNEDLDAKWGDGGIVRRGTRRYIPPYSSPQSGDVPTPQEPLPVGTTDPRDLAMLENRVGRERAVPMRIQNTMRNVLGSRYLDPRRWRRRRGMA